METLLEKLTISSWEREILRESAWSSLRPF